MSSQSLPFLLALYAGWVNRHKQRVVEYLLAENQILKRQLRGKRPRLTDDRAGPERDFPGGTTTFSSWLHGIRSPDRTCVRRPHRGTASFQPLQRDPEPEGIPCARSHKFV